MQFSSSLIRAKLIKRYKRFLADVELENGDIITVHCANPGAMLGLNKPGSFIWISDSKNPKRKLQYSLEIIDIGTQEKPQLVGINTQHPNKIAEESILSGLIPALTGYQNLKREVKYGQNSRIDILLTDENKADCYVEVKNVHLIRQEGLAEFPDCETKRGAKHLDELSDMVAQGKRAVMLYVIQVEDVQKFSIANDLDPNYSNSFIKAREFGVEAYAMACKITSQSIEFSHLVDVIEK